VLLGSIGSSVVLLLDVTPRAALCCVLCCAVLCCAVPCRAVPCRAVPCRAVPCRSVPCCAVLCCAVLSVPYTQPHVLSAFLVSPPPPTVTSYGKRVALHEAGHLLVAYLLGVMPKAFTLSSLDAFVRCVGQSPLFGVGTGRVVV